MVTIEKPPIYKATLVQVVTVVLLALVANGFGSVTLMYSVLTGGVIHILPQAWFSRRVFRDVGASKAPNILKAFYRGEVEKVLMTATLFALTFFYMLPLHIPLVFISYLTMAAVYSFTTDRVLANSRPTKTDVGN